MAVLLVGANQTTHTKIEQREEFLGNFEVYSRGAPFAFCSHILIVLGYLKRIFLDASS